MTMNDGSQVVVSSATSVERLLEPNYTLMASACLLYYEYFLTFSREVHLVRDRPFSLRTAFYLSIRYGAILVITLSVIRNLRPTPTSGPVMTVKSCEVLLSFTIILNMMNYIVISAFVAIRISALLSRSWRLAVLLFMMGLINPVCTTQLLTLAFETTVTPWPLPPCQNHIDDKNIIMPLTLRIFPLVTSATSIVYELVCLLATLSKTLSLWQEQRRIGMPTRFTAMLLCDGSLYFGVMFILAILNIVAASLPQDLLPADIQVNAVIPRALTPILTTRFIAHLQTLRYQSSDIELIGNTEGAESPTTLQFFNREASCSHSALPSLAMPLELHNGGDYT
ncbi:hypothetical protein C8Q79DRAFT_519327 [Trametes meyenii]|nr:hypothetical protein C8Q79DRAFT_519327 [Trametes meyenii]